LSFSPPPPPGWIVLLHYWLTANLRHLGQEGDLHLLALRGQALEQRLVGPLRVQDGGLVTLQTDTSSLNIELDTTTVFYTLSEGWGVYFHWKTWKTVCNVCKSYSNCQITTLESKYKIPLKHKRRNSPGVGLSGEGHSRRVWGVVHRPGRRRRCYQVHRSPAEKVWPWRGRWWGKPVGGRKVI